MTKLAVRTAIRDAIAEEMRADSDVFLIGEEVGEYEGAYKVSQGLLAEFGEKRIIDTPITEAGFTGLAIGAAISGLKPIVEFMTWNFAFQAIDQIINSAAKTNYMSGGLVNVPIVFRGPNGSALQVAAQHSHDLSSIFSNIPGLKVVSPYDSTDAKGLLRASIQDPNPVIFLENELLYNEVFEVPDIDYNIPIGSASIKRPGSDITITAFSRGVSAALGAAPVLFDTTAPSLNRNKAGIPRTPSWEGEFGFSSTLILTIFIFSPYSSDNSSKAGPIILHGPHHSAQKSTTTGVSDLVTSVSNVSSVTDIVAMP